MKRVPRHTIVFRIDLFPFEISVVAARARRLGAVLHYRHEDLPSKSLFRSQSTGEMRCSRGLPIPRRNPTSRTKVLVTGSTGLLGRALRRELSKDPEIDLVQTGFSRAEKAGMVRLNLLDGDSVRETLERERPQLVIHAAAERRPDVSEKDPDGTRALNIDATGALAGVAASVGADTLYLSTDYVFDGAEPPYRPDAMPNPLNFYGESKLAGEVAVRDATERHVVLRVPVLYGQVETLDESPVTVIAKGLLGLNATSTPEPQKQDHWATRYPTLTDDIAFVCAQIARRCGEESPLRGTFHWSGDEPFTKYEMARIICELWELPHEGL
ncbi:MAG: SDR family oxidoreductase, partial [Planctomycetota bacterium]